MATETQYNVFKAIYDEELQRHSRLEDRTKLYLTIITFYLAVIAFKFKDVVDFTNSFRVPIIFYILMALVLLIALLLSISAMRIRDYEGICDLEKVIENLGEESLADEEFLDDRLVDLAVATKLNAQENNKVAKWLLWVSILIFLAVFLHLVVFLLVIYKTMR